jgi:hypothetical protein|tara:strand:+ start:167 stop:568 length:402 start_codon:yes stop_codon:yes gene_type:complete
MNNAEAAILEHHEAINKQDTDGYLETIKFPFTYQNFNGVALTAETLDDYKKRLEMPWEIIKRTEKEWAHSSLDLVEEIARSESSVVFKIAASRINTSGKTDITIHAIWIAVKTDGSWGIQFRHNLGKPVSQKA